MGHKHRSFGHNHRSNRFRRDCHLSLACFLSFLNPLLMEFRQMNRLDLISVSLFFFWGGGGGGKELEVIVLFYWFFIFYLQRVSSQERENTVKKFSCLPPASFTREDSQTPVRSSTNVLRKWNPASAPDQRCKLPHCRMIRHFWHSVSCYHIHAKIIRKIIVGYIMAWILIFYLLCSSG